ncbi:shikimate dehydrogenase [Streptococcus ovuberis]|uniref:Shikimate dehydrogenase (NADP(+)) n=1 Tax=Streptococcus ovuberis TaxID=1936207 RepID=A0A7X6MZP7_9STRE|nr:shikimate dehydrogenase [Streptococcus ovuberis]NKZ20768.1 shikimate dehydrogenase [Streptococcus ovuberis]
MRIDGHTRLAAVVADPIKHSLSPFIHNKAFEQTGVNGVYLAFEIKEEDLAETVLNIKRYDMFGINLSMPYKEKVLPYLDELSPEAALIGAVNTVVNQGGKLVGYNTDGLGFFASLGDFVVKDKEMTLLGAGGAAMAIAAQAALNGAKAIHIVTRSTSIDKAKHKLDSIAKETGIRLTFSALEDQIAVQNCLEQSALLVNATSVGMDGQSNPLPEGCSLDASLLVADIIYRPLETPLLVRAKKEGLIAVNGLGMLLHQAAIAFELWTGQPMPVEDIWPDLLTLL